MNDKDNQKDFESNIRMIDIAFIINNKKYIAYKLFLIFGNSFTNI